MHRRWTIQVLAGAGIVILAEVVDDAVVVGIGLNVSTRTDELAPGATSLALLGSACTDRDTMLRAILRSVQTWFGTWNRAEGDAVGSGLLSAYVEVCDTLGREAAVVLPDGTTLHGWPRRSTPPPAARACRRRTASAGGRRRHPRPGPVTG